MKRANFPGRKNKRRITALSNAHYNNNNTNAAEKTAANLLHQKEA